MGSPKLQNWLSILAMAIGVGSAWATFSSRMRVAETELSYVQEDVADVELDVREINIQLQSAELERQAVKSDFRHVKDKLNTMDRSVSEIKDLLTEN